MHSMCGRCDRGAGRNRTNAGCCERRKRQGPSSSAKLGALRWLKLHWQQQHDRSAGYGHESGASGAADGPHGFPAADGAEDEGEKTKGCTLGDSRSRGRALLPLSCARSVAVVLISAVQIVLAALHEINVLTPGSGYCPLLSTTSFGAASAVMLTRRTSTAVTYR